MNCKSISLIAVILLFSAVLFTPAAVAAEPGSKQILVTSPAFGDGEMIPKKYTCDGEDLSPPLQFSGVPAGAKSLVLICDDPDAPVGTWTHWVLFNLPPDTKMISEKIPASATLPNGAIHGHNSWGGRKIGYGGPCPPSGMHRYYFKVYALDVKLDLPSGTTKKHLAKAMKGHIIGQGELMGTYKRQK
ncbi:MAG: YbhB/YbcL family Raf kinase inhibitor-like protein [Desulfomonile sp.]|nr:YbhB/YbcL family Raf kinase inhibitor-like protein [Desulfomonile sp.]